MITNGKRYAREIKFRIAMTIAAFGKKTRFTNKLGLNLTSYRRRANYFI
jgi:hypothetical protein